MQFQLLKVILWPRDANHEPRILVFERGKLNVITGASKTGKSAMVPIIDYCLGAEKCAIPVGKVREACSWFGVLLDTARGQMLLARREPGIQKSTGDMFIAEGADLDVPIQPPTKNTTVEAVKHQLDDLSQLTKLDFDADDSGGFKGRPSFRDLMAFTFQPQNIVANPDVLFFKADTFEHREKLKTVFPYVLNAVTPAILARQHEAEIVRRALMRKERDLENMKAASERWLARLRAWALEARELGLIETSLEERASTDDLLNFLRHVLQAPPVPVPTRAGISDSLNELISLQKEESDVSSELSQLTRRYKEMKRLHHAKDSYQAALVVQRDRLALSRWLLDMSQGRHSCPICNAPVESGGTVLEELITAMAGVEQESASLKQVPASFEREILRVQTQIDAATQRLAGISLRIKNLEQASKEVSATRFRAESVARYLGRLEQALTTYDASNSDSALAAEVTELRQRLTALNREIGAADIKARTERALEKVALLAGQALPHLDTERPSDPIALSLTDLTIKVKGGDREDYLWEIGSGANWLSYHVAITLGLQQFFVASQGSPVPSFLVYDQPSQVYFPRRLAPTKDMNVEDDPKLNDEDARAVEGVFRFLADVTKTLAGRLQIIVLDHASHDVWGAVDGLNLVDEWRDGRKLVPEDW